MMAKLNESKNTRQSLEIIGSVLYYSLLVLLLVMMVAFFYSRINNRPAFLFGRATLIIVSGSMEPEIPALSCVLIEKVEPEEVIVGDVVTFYSDDPSIAGQLNTHRVTKIDGQGGSLEFITKGDNNLIEDKYTVRAANLVGRYIRVLPVLTFVTRLLLGPNGIYFIVLIFLVCAALLILPELIKKQKAARKAELDRSIAKEVERLRRENEKPDSTSETYKKSNPDSSLDQESNHDATQDNPNTKN